MNSQIKEHLLTETSETILFYKKQNIKTKLIGPHFKMKDIIKYMFATILGIGVATIIGILVLIGIIGSISQSADSIKPSLKPNSVYQIDLEGQLLEREEPDGLTDLISQGFNNSESNSIGLDDILKNIETAKNDSNIIGIYLKGGTLSAGYASLKEIRDALLDFKKSGKFIVAYADNYTQKNYYLVSIANKILLNPQGILEFKGLSTNTMFLKKTLDKIGVEMQIVRVGTFKSAVEPYTNTEMSDSNRIQVSTFVNSIWKNTLIEISKSREIDVNDLNSYADEMMTFQPTEKNLEYKLVDQLVYVDEVDSIIKKMQISKQKKDITLFTHKEMCKISTVKSDETDEIAVLYAIGAIDDPTEDGIQSDEFIKTINELAKNVSVKAVVLRINSPGGSAYGSEQILRALTMLQSKKPVIVSMGDVAASGGYYIASNASKIICEPTTITGSIGIFGIIPNISGLNEKLGISYDGIKTNKMSDAISINRPFTPAEKDLMQAYVNRGYELFVKRCAEGRKLSIDDIKAVADGRVWSGEDALKCGLVDKLGGLNTAIEIAAKKTKLKNYKILSYPEKEELMEQIMKEISKDVESKYLRSKLGDQYMIYQQINKLSHLNGIQARLPFVVDIK